MSPLRSSLALLAALAILSACAPPADDAPPPAAPEPQYQEFRDLQPVTIRGYDGDAMQPFLTPDGRYLLFNNRNDLREDTNLHIAERIDDLTFEYLGEMGNVNTPGLDAVPSMDLANNLYFISTRSYDQTYATLYRGRFDEGMISDIALVPGVSRNQPGQVIFDATISADGTTLFLVDGVFAGGKLPQSANLAIAVRDGAEFKRLPANDQQLINVNAPNALQYAPAVSTDLLELFFTRLIPVGKTPEPAIFRAARKSTGEPFGIPERVAAITGYAEAAALSPDGHALYYSKRDGGHFVIQRIVR